MNDPGFSCISPVDGRYVQSTKALRAFFSEKALIKYRLLVEVEYFIALCDLAVEPLADFPAPAFDLVRSVYKNCDDKDITRIKIIERTTNHDIKAIEYFIKEKFDELGLGKYRELVHFGLTSQDINNTAIPLSFKEGLGEVVFPAIESLIQVLKAQAISWINIPMLAHTHGQPASPTTVGKEILVFHDRIQAQYMHLRSLPFPAKFGGATGNFNAHHVAFPAINWPAFANTFTKNLGLQRSQHTTQIDHYDQLACLFDALKRICTIIIDLDRDCWSYISMNYFSQKINPHETGSSAMPHKVNPIDFENSEGNAGLAVAVFEHLSAKLPISRLQRDLTDSTVLRNIGVPLAHMLIAIKSSLRGLEKINLNSAVINQDLDDNMAVVAEAIQTILRKLNEPNPYEKLKELTRKEGKLTRHDLDNFIDQLAVSDDIKQLLKSITPFNYTGIIPDITQL